MLSATNSPVRNPGIITPETLTSNPEIDQQGIRLRTLDREFVLGQYRRHYTPFFSVLTETPKIKVQTPNCSTPLFKFEQFNRTQTIPEQHKQLTNHIVAISENHVIFAGGFHIFEYNLKTNKMKSLLSAYSYCVDYFAKSELICGTQMGDSLFLFDLKSKQKLLESRFCEAELVNNVRFVNSRSPAMLVCANHPQVGVYDLETLKVREFVNTPAFVNYADFCETRNLYALALDDTRVQVSDGRTDGKRPLFLEGHLDYNFAARFMGNDYLATGGQDCSIRIWDLRQLKCELYVLESRGREISSIIFNERNQTIYAIETLESLSAFRVEEGVWVKSWMDFLGKPKGISFVPGMNKLIMALFENNWGGILKVELL